MTEPREIDMIRAALQEATSAARTAEASANALSLTINGTDEAPGLRGRLEDNTRELRRLSRQNVWQWVLVVVVAVAVLLGTWSYVQFRQYQDCRNRYTQAFLDAERAKVSGQIAGLNQLGTDPRAGVTQFRSASQNYLDTIGKVPAKC